MGSQDHLHQTALASLKVDCPVFGPVALYHGPFGPPAPTDVPVVCKLDNGEITTGTVVSGEAGYQVIEPLGGGLRSSLVRATATVGFIQILAICLVSFKRGTGARLLDIMGVINVYCDFLT
jgi:hypothetical protein